jgi:hypothetical protein
MLGQSRHQRQESSSDSAWSTLGQLDCLLYAFQVEIVFSQRSQEVLEGETATRMLAAHAPGVL